MAEEAAAAVDAPILKIKLDSEIPIEKLVALRSARPDAKLVVDANQNWDVQILKEMLPVCKRLRVDLIEQPLRRGDDAVLEELQSPVMLAADESCLHSGELDIAAKRYGMINIKLDKSGGLTEALRLARGARAKGCQLMVGNMVGTSLSMPPSFVVAQLCDFVDIDGPLLLQHDRANGLIYRNGIVEEVPSGLWGGTNGTSDA